MMSAITDYIYQIEKNLIQLRKKVRELDTKDEKIIDIKRTIFVMTDILNKTNRLIEMEEEKNG